ncbi:MAG TPA: acetoacetate decarboxylase family protein [Acidimicrobiales bacterium]|nr:acetoacetate decarboxylase family protein [Acidimicrobiales bacterium]
MVSEPGPPWRLRGECAIAWIGAVPDDSLPHGFERLPGPSVLIAARYTDSPVGPYVELAVARPARRGARFGLCVTTMAVNSSESVAGGRSNWGFPKELSQLRWRREGHWSSLWSEELGVEVKARPHGPEVPLAAPLWCLQRRADGPVHVPGRLRGRFRLAGVQADAKASDRLRFVDGHHRGVVVTELRLDVGAARRIGQS